MMPIIIYKNNIILDFNFFLFHDHWFSTKNSFYFNIFSSLYIWVKKDC